VNFIVLQHRIEGDLSVVSGYYGLGSFPAWVVTALISLYTSMKEEKASNLDAAGWVATAAYPMIASVDAVRRLFIILLNGTYGGDAQYNAAVAVCQWGRLLIFPLVYPTDLERDGADSRSIIWSIVWTVCALPVFFESPLCSSPFTLAKMFFNGTCGVASWFVWSTRDWAASFLVVSLMTGFGVVFGIFYPWPGKDEVTSYKVIFCKIKDQPVTIRFPYPRSSARLSDLDQAAAFGAAVLTLILVIGSRSRRIKGVLKKLKSRLQEPDIELEAPLLGSES
jgi:hypothetical protein